MKILFRIIAYIKFYFKSGNAHGLHSPFVFDLYIEEISNNKQFYVFEEIEKLRHDLLTSFEKIKINDLGAGKSKNSLKKINQIASSSLSKPSKCELLFKLVNRFQPQNILEIGTSLGISTLYLATANKKTLVYTFEGSEATYNIACENFKKLNIENIKPILGDFNTTLLPIINSLPTIDFVYFDGNHQYTPTLEYFEWCLQKANENSVFIFDDIYWSAEMSKAWKEICAREDVKISIDLYDLGLVFFRNNQPKQHFVLRA